MASPRIRSWVAAASVVLAVLAAPAGAQSAEGYSVTIAVSSMSGIPLGYATVAVAETRTERFANGSGELYFSGLAAGSYHVRVKQLGYSARDVVVNVGPELANSRVLVRLEPIAFLLDRVVVMAPSQCPEPTDLSDPRNTDLALILGEVRKNAERHNLLLNRYPFIYRFAREFVSRTRFLGGRDVRRDTVEFTSSVAWKYEPGSVVHRDSTEGSSAELMLLPQLSDLADSTFQENHCFYYRGQQRRDGEPQHQIDFIPLGSIAEPDVAGSIFISAKSYVLRSAVFRLHGGDRFIPPLPDIEVHTTYKEIYPNIVLFSEIEGVQPMFQSGANGQYSYVEVRQKQKLVGYKFNRGAPGDSVAAGRYDAAQALAAKRDSLSATLGSVGGTIFSVDKYPIGSAKVVAGENGEHQAAAGSDGRFILARLRSGDTQITVSAPGFSTIRILVEVVAGETVTLALVLYPDT